MEITTPNPVGRPTKYDPKFCKTVIECGKAGMSKIEMSCECGVYSFEALKDWAKRETDFSEALEMALALSKAWWERQGRLGVFDEDGRRLNSGYTKQMAARFPEDWREQSNVTLDATIQKKVKAKFSERTDD